MKDAFASGRAALMDITARPALVFTRGEGSWLWDGAGRRYLDFVQGWAVNCLGHCPPEIRDALAGPIPVHSLKALRRRTRVMMGRCQGFFCGARVEGMLRAGKP